MTPKGTNHVRFVELEDGPYREYRKDQVRHYAADKVRAGHKPRPRAAQPGT